MSFLLLACPGGFVWRQPPGKDRPPALLATLTSLGQQEEREKKKEEIKTESERVSQSSAL
jgi:hypothetical protein